MVKRILLLRPFYGLFTVYAFDYQTVVQNFDDDDDSTSIITVLVKIIK